MPRSALPPPLPATVATAPTPSAAAAASVMKEAAGITAGALPLLERVACARLRPAAAPAPAYAPTPVAAAPAAAAPAAAAAAADPGVSATPVALADMSPAHLQAWLASEGHTKQAAALEGIDGAWLASASDAEMSELDGLGRGSACLCMLKYPG